MVIERAKVEPTRKCAFYEVAFYEIMRIYIVQMNARSSDARSLQNLVTIIEMCDRAEEDIALPSIAVRESASELNGKTSGTCDLIAASRSRRVVAYAGTEGFVSTFVRIHQGWSSRIL